MKTKNGAPRRTPQSLKEDDSFLTLLENGARKPRPKLRVRSRGLDVVPDSAPAAKVPAPAPAPTPVAVLAAAGVQTWDSDPDAPAPATQPVPARPTAEPSQPPAIAPAPTPMPAVEPVASAPVAAPTAGAPEAVSPPVLQAGTYRVIDGGTLPDPYEIDRDIDAINDPRLEKRQHSARQQAIDSFLRQLSATAPSYPRAEPADYIDAIADTEELTRPSEQTTKKTAPAPAAMKSIQNIKIETLTPDATTVDKAVKDNGCGGYVWRVTFELPVVAANDGWIIQEIDGVYDVKDATGAAVNIEVYHYWEAWEVKKGKKFTVFREGGDPYDDTYEDPSYPGNKGKMGALGKARFYEGKLPADFKTYNADTYAGMLHSTKSKPAFWDGAGTQHDLMSEFDCTTAAKKEKIEAVADGVKIPVVK